MTADGCFDATLDPDAPITPIPGQRLSMLRQCAHGLADVSWSPS